MLNNISWKKPILANELLKRNKVKDTLDNIFFIENDENKPRYNSLKWYLEIIGLDFREVIKIVNKMNKMY